MNLSASGSARNRSSGAKRSTRITSVSGTRSTTSGTGSCQSVYVGIYADVDAGPREYGSYHMDDQVGFFRGDWCANIGTSEIPIEIHVAYVYDSDGDGGKTTSYFGIALLGHSTDPNSDGRPAAPIHRRCSTRSGHSRGSPRSSTEATRRTTTKGTRSWPLVRQTRTRRRRQTTGSC